MNQQDMQKLLQQHYAVYLEDIFEQDMLTVEVKPDKIKAFCLAVRDAAVLKFSMLVDLCGIDYSDYGISYWRQEESTSSGYARAVSAEGERVKKWDKPRFAVIYHLLSIEHNHRLRIKVYLPSEPQVDSVIDIWPSANWYEREAFDLFGIFFAGHPDLRRLLTDYGFNGHPFRKDFPLIGEVEMRYDAAQEACVYEPVSIQPRVLVPKIIRDDHRYVQRNEEGEDHA